MTKKETVRIYDLSKEIGVTNKEVTDVLDKLKISYKTISSNISAADADKVKVELVGTAKKATTSKTSTKKPAAKKTTTTKAAPAKKPVAKKEAVKEASTVKLVVVRQGREKDEEVEIKAGSTVAQVERDLGLSSGVLIGQGRALKPTDEFKADTTVFVATAKRAGCTEEKAQPVTRTYSNAYKTIEELIEQSKGLFTEEGEYKECLEDMKAIIVEAGV